MVLSNDLITDSVQIPLWLSFYYFFIEKNSKEELQKTTMVIYMSRWGHYWNLKTMKSALLKVSYETNIILLFEIYIKNSFKIGIFLRVIKVSWTYKSFFSYV